MHKNKKATNPIDLHIGERIRLRRTVIGMSQKRLGDEVGVAFQQIQKYERGLNRVGASRLQLIAGALKVPISFFFNDSNQVNEATFASTIDNTVHYLTGFLRGNEGLELNRAFMRIRDPSIRNRIIQLAKALGSA